MTTETDPNAPSLTVQQVATRYNVSTDTIWRWKRDGTFPKGIRVGPGVTRWRLTDLMEHERTMRAAFVFSLCGQYSLDGRFNPDSSAN